MPPAGLLVSREPSVALTERGWTIEALAWSPDGSRLAVAANASPTEDSPNHRVYVWSADGELRSTSSALGGAALSLAWSDDGRRLATGGSEGVLRLWNPDGTLHQAVTFSDGAIHALAWSPNENTLAVGVIEQSQEGELPAYVYLLDSHTEINSRLEGGPTRAGSYKLEWSADGSLLVGGAVDFHAWTPRGVEVLSVSPDPPAWRTKVGVGISLDGQSLIIGNASFGVSVYSMDGGHVSAVVGPSAFSLSPDGSTVALVSTALIQLAHLGALDKPVASIPSGSATDIVWAPDGEWLATSLGGGVSVWDLNGTRMAKLEGCDGSATVLGRSPDGALLAAGYSTGQVCVWDVSGL